MHKRTIISYFPPVKDTTLLEAMREAILSQDTPRLSEILIQYEIISTNLINGAKWLDNHTLILSLENAKIYYDHINAWADKNIAAYFNVSIEKSGSGYEFMLWPDIEKTIDRHQTQHIIEHEEFTPSDITYNVLFCPIVFRTDKGYTPCPLPTDSITIGFADSSHKPSNYKITLEDVKFVVKNIPVKHLRKTADE